MHSADLWFYKLPDTADCRRSLTVIITLLDSGNTEKHVAHATTNIVRGWMTVNVTKTVQNLLRHSTRDTHLIQITCEHCDRRANLSIVTQSKNEPFMLIRTKEMVKHRTKREAPYCIAGSQTCCKQRLNIDFRSIGWDKWIINPPGYEANICRGECRSGKQQFIIIGLGYTVEPKKSTYLCTIVTIDFCVDIAAKHCS